MTTITRTIATLIVASLLTLSSVILTNAGAILTTAEIHQWMLGEAAKMNKQLPKRVDAGTVLLSVFVDGSKFVYVNQIEYYIADLDIYHTAPGVKQKGIRETCKVSELVGLMRDYGVSYVYSYFDLNKVRLFSNEVTLADCS